MAGLDFAAGRVAVITGAASGIGRAIAVECSIRGMRVVLADIDTNGLDGLAAELAGQGREGLAMRCDTASATDVQDLAEVVAGRYGQVHLLVNNAGVAGAAGPSWMIGEADWRWTLDVNLFGPVNVLRCFLPRMIEGGGPGWVINIASLSGLLPTPGAAPYSASKAALLALSEALSLELKQAGALIGVTIACPAAVATSIASSLRPTSPDAGDTVQTSASALACGMAPEEAARRILAAAEDGRFSLFTHAGSEAVVKERNRQLLEGGDPVLPDWDLVSPSGE